MDPRLKEALLDLALSVLKGTKVFLIYIVPSAIVALLLSSELRDYLTTKPEFIGLVPMINVVLVTVADMVKRQLPDNQKVQTIL